MSAQAIPSPLPNFIGLNALPLSGGYVYIGEPDTDPRSNPVNVFYDEAMAVPASQPLRTLAGYLYRNGTPTNIWVEGAYSVLVLDSNGRQVFYLPRWVGASSGAVLFLQAGTGAVERSVESKLREIEVSPGDFEGDVALNDNYAALLKACEAVRGTDKKLVIPDGTWRCSAALDMTSIRKIDMRGEIYFYNSTDGVTIGRTTGVTNNMSRANIRVRVRGVVDAVGTTGVICRGIWRSEVHGDVDGFEYGWEHRMGNGEYVAGCNFYLTLRNSRVKLRFNSSSTAFCSDNRYPGLVANKQDETLTPTIGVEWADNTAPSNNNIFEKAWLENNDTPVKFAGECSWNKFPNARLEGAGDVVFTTGGTNGGACGNLVTSDLVSDELSFWSEYTSDSPFPNFVDSGLYQHERTVLNEVTWRDWHHRSATADRHYICPKLTAKDSGGFTFGSDYFDWATIDDAAYSFTITNFDEGYFDVPVSVGDQFELGIFHDTTSVASNATVVRLEALDMAKAALPGLGAGQLPYFGTTRHSSAGHSGTGSTLNIQNDRARLSTGVRINRTEVKYLRVVLLSSVEFYKVFLLALHDRYSRPGGGAGTPSVTPFKYIDSLSVAPDFTGQLAKVRGVEWIVTAVEGKWRPVGALRNRAALAAGTVVVSLGLTMPDANYHVQLTAMANETVYVSAKTTTTFTITSSNGASANQVEWQVMPKN